MKKGYLSEYFAGVAAKRLSAVECDVLRSNQHEFNGSEALRDVLGEPVGKVYYSTTVLYLDDDESEPIAEQVEFTWYDARQKARLERGVMRWEYRLYFPTTVASSKAGMGDLLLIAKLQTGELLVIVAARNSSMAQQIEWLFGLSKLDENGFSIADYLERNRDKIEFSTKIILGLIGVEIIEPRNDYLETMLSKFKGILPTTREFSAFARTTLKGLDPIASPDEVLVAWMEREEELFRTLERHLISEQISAGFYHPENGSVDVDKFIKFSLSVQNRRKSRVGLAFENHVEVIFQKNNIQYVRTATTENRSKPDFLFPGSDNYSDANFDENKLTMLGVKSTCKDRWRQILAEADRIDIKHLLTLEGAISKQQTDEMAAKGVRLVVPRAFHHTYALDQQGWLMDLSSFISLVKSKQEKVLA